MEDHFHAAVLLVFEGLIEIGAVSEIIARGHQRLKASADLLVVGAYPASGSYDECRSEEDREGSELACVHCEVRRQLKEDWPRLVAKDRQPLVEEMQAVDRILGQAFPVGDKLRRLPGEDEMAPGLITPTPNRLCCGRAVEDTIQFHCVELARVIFELMLAGTSIGKNGPRQDP
jgi:hypothetical protein